MSRIDPGACVYNAFWGRPRSKCGEALFHFFIKQLAADCKVPKQLKIESPNSDSINKICGIFYGLSFGLTHSMIPTFPPGRRTYGPEANWGEIPNLIKIDLRP